MANRIFTNIENSLSGYKGCAITHYFDVAPSNEEVAQACIDTQDDFDIFADSGLPTFSWVEKSTAVSTLASLARVEVNPVCYRGNP